VERRGAQGAAAVGSGAAVMMPTDTSIVAETPLYDCVIASVGQRQPSTEQGEGTWHSEHGQHLMHEGRTEQLVARPVQVFAYEAATTTRNHVAWTAESWQGNSGWPSSFYDKISNRNHAP